MRLIGWAMGISFTGSLPPGTLNLTVAHLTLDDNLKGAAMFAIAAIFVEMVLVRLALLAVHQLEKWKALFRLFNLIAGAILLLMAFNSLTAAWNRHLLHIDPPFKDLPPFLLGIFLSIINPLHVPFWIGWTTVLRARYVLNDGRGVYNYYVLAIGVGTALAFTVYAVAGRFLTAHMQAQQVLLNWLIGIVLMIMAIQQLYKAVCSAAIYRDKAAAGN